MESLALEKKRDELFVDDVEWYRENPDALPRIYQSDRYLHYSNRQHHADSSPDWLTVLAW